MPRSRPGRCVLPRRIAGLFLLGVGLCGATLVAGCGGDGPAAGSATTGAANANEEPSELSQPASRWLLMDPTARVALLRKGAAQQVDRMAALAAAKIGTRADLKPPTKDDVAADLARDVNAFFERNRNLLADWTLQDLINGTALHFRWDSDQTSNVPPARQ